MRYRPYFLLGDTQRNQLRSRFASAIDEWSNLWLPENSRPVALGSEIVASSSVLTHADDSWRIVRAGKKELGWTQASNVFLKSLLAVSAGASAASADGGPLAIDLGMKLYVDLLARLLNVVHAGLEIDADSGAAPAHLFAPGGNAVRMTVNVGSCSADLLIAAEVVATLTTGLERRARTVPKLTRIQSAISATRLRLRVTIDLPDGIAIEDLEDLREGHVIVLDQPPSAAWEIRGVDGALLGRCRPGRAGDQFAVKPLEAARPS